MDLAQIITFSGAYVVLAFLPPVIWLLVYLREDTHPEPFYLILLTFIGGIGTAFAALIAEKGLLEFISPEEHLVTFFICIALIEEYAKYLAVKLIVLKRIDFNEPIDAMVYMVTAGLGFAAIENFLFLIFQSQNLGSLLLPETLLAGASLSVSRFIGANLLHALASAIVGYFLARAWFHPLRKHLIMAGILIASALHALFNYLIIVKDIFPEVILYLIALLGLALVIVLIDFHRLRKDSRDLSESLHNRIPA
jgi:RsiW-degrading membrane proteinase PrsW (M82 family)